MRPFSFALSSMLLGASLLNCSSTPSSDARRTEDVGAPKAAPASASAPPAVALRSPAVEDRAHTPRAAAASLAPTHAFLAPYPPAAWRLAPRGVLADTVLWFDQILIQHAAVRNEACFNLAYWFRAEPAQPRSRDAALAIARSVAAEASRHPDSFPELARRHSEDLVSRDEGGALGGMWASELDGWPHVLDALAALSAGGVSQVVETRYGFHVFRRREPPAEQLVSGAHIVIGYDDAEWLKVLARGPLPRRSRADARALALQIYREASEHPERFRQLVERYSEDRDALVGGDLGNWSTREPTMFPGRLRRLAQLAIGEVGAPVETHLGFEVILRTAPAVRQQLAARVHPLAFEPSAPEGAETSRSAVLARASELARDLAAAPAGFGDSVPSAMLQWEDGRQAPSLSEGVKNLALGAVSPEPILTEFSFKIVQRLPPEPVTPARYASELPAPERAELRAAGELKVAAIEAVLRATERRAHAEHGLPTATQVRQRELARHLEALDESADSGAKLSALGAFLAQTREQLGARRYSRYELALDRELRSALLEGAPAYGADPAF